jgi:hypothetical protein
VPEVQRPSRTLDPIARALRNRRVGVYVIVSKRTLARLPSSYEQTLLGTPPALAHSGAIRQYRGPARCHVYETVTAWIAHRDHADPRGDPLGHFLIDTPELAGAAIAGGVTGMAVYRRRRAARLANGATEEDANRDAAFAGILSGLLAAGAAYVVISAVKSRRRR